MQLTGAKGLFLKCKSGHDTPCLNSPGAPYCSCSKALSPYRSCLAFMICPLVISLLTLCTSHDESNMFPEWKKNVFSPLDLPACFLVLLGWLPSVTSSSPGYFLSLKHKPPRLPYCVSAYPKFPGKYLWVAAP